MVITNENYPAFEVSPVSIPAPGATAPQLFRALYGMPMFVTIPTANLAESTEFWIHALGFFGLFAIPGRLVHLRPRPARRHSRGLHTNPTRLGYRAAHSTMEFRRTRDPHSGKCECHHDSGTAAGHAHTSVNRSSTT
ncbi:hypothetical protein CH254_08845 [Rhodococcus sp. 06-412-2C]|nr:hypothetical protein CH254_08845 [Rhodococcus sp. 06-412-2C]